MKKFLLAILSLLCVFLASCSTNKTSTNPSALDVKLGMTEAEVLSTIGEKEFEFIDGDIKSYVTNVFEHDAVVSFLFEDGKVKMYNVGFVLDLDPADEFDSRTQYSLLLADTEIHNGANVKRSFDMPGAGPVYTRTTKWEEDGVTTILSMRYESGQYGTYLSFLPTF
jgi:hypothetical protein